jgi:hypothetical protein
MLSIKEDDFPSPDRLVKAVWVPILLRPILGSPEQFVVGVVAVNETGFYVARANQLNRLFCVFAEEAHSAILAAEASLDALSTDLATRSLEAVRDFRPMFSGVSCGEVTEAQGESLEKIASSWMSSLSSLYSTQEPVALMLSDNVLSAEDPYRERQRDRLPGLIYDYINSRRPGLASFFSEEIRDRTMRRRSNASAVLIDYAGSKVVANFGTLLISNHPMSVDRIKRRLWDLKVSRDAEREPFVKRDHEMLVQHPTSSDPQFSPRQLERISDALRTLEEQADQELIRFRPMHTVQEIGEHLLEREAA